MLDKDCHIIHLPEVTSTNSYAKEMLKDKRPPEGTVIVADHQTAGKGQDGNSWESEAGKNILMTLILYPSFVEISSQFRISMAVALGIIDFLKEILPDQRILIKWPNDIYVGKGKIGGILINNEIMGDHFEHVIAGIGLNVNQLRFPTELADSATSLLLASGKEVDRACLLGALLGLLLIRGHLGYPCRLEWRWPEWMGWIKKVFPLAISNILGSNLIMVFLIFPADLFYWSGPILNHIDKSAAFALGSGILVTAIYCAGLLIRRKERIFNIGIDSALVLLIYAASLIIFYHLR